MVEKHRKKRTQTEIELEAKEESLSATLLMLEEFAPIVIKIINEIPDAVTDYHLARGGLQSDDVRLKRLLALATQKFISDIAADAMQFAKVRQQIQSTRDKKAVRSDKRTVLTMEDLSAALAENGVSIKKPEYYN